MRKTKAVCAAFILGLGMLCMSLLSFGQSTLGSVDGTVKDPGGAVLSGAQVTLLNLGTGSKLETVTNAEGMFSFRNLPVGTYSVQAQATGFAIQEKTGLQLYANQAVTADMQMKVSATQNRVEVSAAPSLIDTHSSHLSDVITGSALLKMPELSRQSGAGGIVEDLYFMPGSQNPGYGSYPAINGGRFADTMITMDGMSVMSNASNYGAGPVQPSEEAIQEIHTVLANAPAEFWRPAAVTVVSKSGTNQVHGSLFEDYNSDALNAKSFFASQVPYRLENNFAASIGGPIKKDKLFFFGDYEGGRNSAQVVVVGNVPLPAWHTGDLSSIGTPIINPYTGTPFPNNQIPANMISSVSQNLQAALFPLPNFGAPGLQSGNFRTLEPGQNGWDVFNNGDASLDFNASKRDTLFIRESYRELPVTSFEGSLPSVGRYVEHRIGASGVITENHIFSPTLINEIRLGYTDMKLVYYAAFNGYDLLTKAGMQGPFTTFTPLLAVPSITISSVSGTSGSLANRVHHEVDYEWNDNLSWTVGKHSLKFGIDQILDHFTTATNPGTIFGSYAFNGAFTGNGYADFLLGLPQRTTITTPLPIGQLHGVLLAAYAQDQFQVNQRLTLNYGVRWEYQGPYSGAPYLLYSFDPKNGNVVIPTQAGLSHLSPYFPTNIPVETAAQAGYPSSTLMFSHYLDFYPRLGFAYRLFPNAGTVLRGAYGVYGNNIYANLGNHQLGGPFSGSATFTNKMVNGSPLFSFPDPFLASGTIATQSISAVDPHATVPYTQQWNLTLEQAIGATAIITATYVGTASRRLLLPFNLDQPPPSKTPFSTSELAYPNYSEVDWIKNAGVENYDSFQLSLRKTQGRNLFIDVGFSVNKDLTDTEDYGDAFGAFVPENRFCLGCEYGNSDNNRHLYTYLNTNYMLPFGRDQHFAANTGRLWNAVISGWDLAADGAISSGQYFTPYVSSGFDTANTNTSFTQRPDQIGNPHVPHPSIDNWFNINAFAIPGCPASDPNCTQSIPANVGRFGNVRPMTLVGPDYVNFDLSIMRDFKVRNRGTFEIRLTSQNALNHPNFDIPDQYVTDGPGVAGIVTGLSPLGPGPRETDIMARFRF